MGSWKPHERGSDDGTRTSSFPGDWHLGPTDLDVVLLEGDIRLRRTELSAMHGDWCARRISDGVVRAALPGCWMRDGSSLEAAETLAMLRSVGPISDSPEWPMPKRFRVYQGRLSGEALGISWSPELQIAAGYSRRWQAVRKSRGDDLEAVLWTGTVRDFDVLMLLRLTSEVIVALEDVSDVHEIPVPASARVSDAWLLPRSGAWFLSRKDYLAAVERETTGFVRYLAWRHAPDLAARLNAILPGSGVTGVEMVMEKMVGLRMATVTNRLKARDAAVGERLRVLTTA